jgi:hypothetical protein
MKKLVIVFTILFASMFLFNTELSAKSYNYSTYGEVIEQADSYIYKPQSGRGFFAQYQGAEHIKAVNDAVIWNKPDKTNPNRPSHYCLRIINITEE